MRLYPTRGKKPQSPEFVRFSEAILSPAADFGGLYAPVALPTVSAAELESYKNLSYKALCKTLLTKLEVDLDEALIDEALRVYDGFDDPANPVPLHKLNDRTFVSELWHGPTRAFKDMALQPFGVILSALAQKRGEHYLILAATSGDTGPAALKSFENRPGAQVVCLYPDGGTSDVQRLQMVTVDAPNLKVIGIHGDFDDAQNALKALLASESFNGFVKEKGISLSAANSVNFGRILFQILYHFHSYLELLRNGEIALGDAVDLVVPSGNFGNALGAYYARKMGLPVGKILIASNNNNVLTDLIVTGRYDLRSRKLVKTTSPAMDILKSSNVERILFDLFGPERTRELMEQLANDGAYQVSEAELETLRSIFDAAWSNEDEVNSAIREAARKGYVMDPHTATCLKAASLGNGNKRILYSTAEWTKFAPLVLQAIGGKVGASDKEALEAIKERYKVKVPAPIEALFALPITQKEVIDRTDIEGAIRRFL
ncbi:MAG: threonine synthase [Campylobacterales bacterium]